MKSLWNWFKKLFKKEVVYIPPVIVRDHTPSSDFTPSQYVNHYKELWATMVIDEKKKSTINWYTKQAIRNRERYEKVAAISSVPWEVIAAIHLLESGGDFAGALHNGDKIIGTGKKTYRAPRGRGPFNTWEESAIDALAIKRQPSVWNVENTLHYLERYNGLGYLRDASKPHSPYLWSFSNHYVRGKYTHDGKYSLTAVSKQCGVAVILKELGFLTA